MEVAEKSEWWRVVIGCEENACGEVVIFWDKSWAKSYYILGRMEYFFFISCASF